MAYINVADWTPDQVADWLKGLDDSMYNYVYSFTNNEVGGKELLNVRPYELEQLSMTCIGHQEIVLEAVENLRNFHYHFKNDNLQFMALYVATAAHNLHRELGQNHPDAAKIETRFLHDITRTIATIKPLIGWLERAPFRDQVQYREFCHNMLRVGLELATIAQRDRFVERPVIQIRATAEKLERLANFIIQDLSDPMVLQPASLNLVTLKKRESELGFNIESSSNGTHRVIDIKYNSPAHNSGKIEDGDEIVQINYQTVVGWQHKSVLSHLREALPDVVLTLKKRPKHTKMYGQIYMQPYRLPSRKRWNENMPSPKPPDISKPPEPVNFKLPEIVQSVEKVNAVASSDSDSSDSDTKSNSKRLYNPKPRALLQRRNTICGDEISSLKLSDHDPPSWHERRTGGTVCDPGSPSLRDKSLSFGFGLEIAPRPTTCLGITGGGAIVYTADAKTFLNENKKLQQLSEATESQQDLLPTQDKNFKPGVSKVVRFDANMKMEDYTNKNEKYTCNIDDTILETFEPIPFADEGEEDALEMLRSCKTDKAVDLMAAIDMATKEQETPLVEAINVPLLQNRRGRLDKSHSTPAYDNSAEESNTPPAVEPRKEFLLVTPPIPPPRPRKQKELTPPVLPPPPPKPASLQPTATIQLAVTAKTSIPTEISELHTPTKSRTLTLKKKSSLMAKRRNINLKMLGTGDIQGHLYRRKKDHRGVTYWARIYFVMLDTILYGFRTKQSNSANCVIFLPGFTVSLAKEVHSKPYAFKVYHAAKTFYFAAESQDALNQWVEFLRQASLQSVPPRPEDTLDTKDLFSENDSSGEENDALVAKNVCTPSPQIIKDLNASLNKSVKSANTPTSSNSNSNKHDRSYLGSLRKLTMVTFKSNNTKMSSDIPVPTEQYRSYRKVPGGSFGIQIGANTPGYHDPSMQLSLTQANDLTLQRKLSRSSSRSSVVSNTESLASFGLGPPSSPAPTITFAQQLQPQPQSQNSLDTMNRSVQKMSYDASDIAKSNLVDFDFQMSKTLDRNISKIGTSSVLVDSTHHPHSTVGFVTLKELMLRKQEEEAQEMYNNRVLLGVERKHGQHKRTESGASKQQEPSAVMQAVSGDEKVSKTQSRSLPKTPDYEISFKPDDEDIKRTRTKEGLKLRDFGYELISGDEPFGGSILGTSRQDSYNERRLTDHQPHTSYTGGGVVVSANKTRQFLRSQQFTNFLPKSAKKHSSVSFSTDLGSSKKKGKLASERIFSFHKHSSGGNHSAALGNVSTTMTLPLNKKSKSNHALERITSISGSIRKSQTYNQDLRDKAVGRYDCQRKNSAPMPLLTKLSVSSSSNMAHNSFSSNTRSTKEKRLLGSPLLHRTIFGHDHILSPAIPITPNANVEQDCDQEIFTQVIFPTHPQRQPQLIDSGTKNRDITYATKSITNICTTDGLTPPLPPAPPPPNFNTSIHEPATPKLSSNLSVDSKAATPDYPNMECPPVFEPEIYSLTEPNTSLTLLMRRTNNNSSGNNANIAPGIEEK